MYRESQHPFLSKSYAAYSAIAANLYDENLAILDGSDLETTEKCKDCGKVKRQKEVTGKIIDIYTYSFKLIALMDCHTQIRQLLPGSE